MPKQRYRVAIDYATGRVFVAVACRTAPARYLALRCDSRPEHAALFSYNVARAVAQRNGGVMVAVAASARVDLPETRAAQH